MTKNKKKSEESIAVKLMENFIESGKYPQLKQTKDKVKVLTSAMKQRLESSENKRHEFKKYGLVGRFVAKKIYETDIQALNEYLYDIGLLPFIVEIDNKKIEDNIYYDFIQEFRLPTTYYLKPSFNKEGNALNKLKNFTVNEQWSIEDIARSIRIMKPQIKMLNYEFESLKKKIMKTSDIATLCRMKKEERKPLKHKYGSLSIVEHQPRYDIPKILDSYGEDILIEYGVPNQEKLESFILNGTLTANEVNQFRTIVDVRLDFSIMTLEDEKKFLEFLDNKQKTAAINRNRIA